MIIQGQVGQTSLQSALPGQAPFARVGQQGDLIMSQLHGRYYETNYRGNVFTTFANAVLAVSTHATPLAAGTGTPIISIYNPFGSGKNVSLLRLQISVTAAVTTGSPFLWNIIPNPQNITQTFALPYNMSNLLQVGSGSVARVFNNVALTNSTQGTAYRIIGGGTTGTATGQVMTLFDVYDGSLIVYPGTMIALVTVGTGNGLTVNAWAEWEEIPI